MKRILVVSGSRADYGLLEWPIKKLQEDGAFDVRVMKIWGFNVPVTFTEVKKELDGWHPDLMLILGDRFEILAAATAAHLQRIPIAHIGGGDVTEGSYDDAMRDCISRMSSVHFVTSTSAMARLSHMGFRNVHLVGNPGIDYIRNADWKKERPIVEPYVVVSYQAETIDGTSDIRLLTVGLDPKVKTVFIMPNPDRGSDHIRKEIETLRTPDDIVYDFLPHAEFLNLIFHCEEFIGNSSAMLYEAPELGVKVRMVGKRQRGRTIPFGDGFASERIVKILKYAA
jgi:UDP-hydrolysing UDP-N-acetyl-D-glucosamine 2-epimerase